MYDEIVYPTDGSEPAAEVLEYALQVVGAHDARLRILNVADTNRDSLTQIQGDVVDVLETEGERIVTAAADRASERGVSVLTDVLQGDPAETIVEYSDQVGADLVVMPTHGRRGLKRFLLGSVTERVINTASVPVTSVNPSRDGAPTYPCEQLLVPTDGSPAAAAALEEGIQLAKAIGATLHVLHVVETGTLGLDARSLLKEGEHTERAKELMDDTVDIVESEGLEDVTTTIEAGSPAREILAYVDEHDIGLALLGTHGETAFNSYVLGGVSSKIVRTSPVPVMWTHG